MGGGKPSVDPIVNLGALAMPACLVHNGGANTDASPGRTSIDEAAVDGQSGRQPRTGRHPVAHWAFLLQKPQGADPGRQTLRLAAHLCQPGVRLLRAALSPGPPTTGVGIRWPQRASRLCESHVECHNVDTILPLAFWRRHCRCIHSV